MFNISQIIGQTTQNQAKRLVCLLFYAFCNLLITIDCESSTAWAGPIYVIERTDGSTTFSSQKPKNNQKFEIFDRESARFSLGQIKPYKNSRLFLDRYNQWIIEAALKFNLDTSLIKAIIHVESAFNPEAISPKGATGLMQLMPSTAKQHGVKDINHPKENIFGGAQHLALLMQHFKGDIKMVLAAYNAGQEAVEKYKGIPPFKETINYVQKVLYYYKKYKYSKYK